MEKVVEIIGRGVPLERENIDTDQIIPSDWLKSVERIGFGRGLFSEWREDPNFILNDERYKGATILFAGKNFGIGSSREHAVWALLDYGFKAVVSPKFGDIFKVNCTKVGLLPVEIDSESFNKFISIVKDNPNQEFLISVKSLAISALQIDLNCNFILDEFTQYRFLNGLDDIGLTLRHEDAIREYEKKRFSWLPSL